MANNDVTVTGPLGGLRHGIRLVGSEDARLVNNSIAGDGRMGVSLDYALGCRIQSTAFEAFTPRAVGRLWRTCSSRRTSGTASR